jgi:hypothetical protein
MKYREEKTLSGAIMIVRTNEDGSETWIPTDPSNSDYQAYLNKDTLPSNSADPAAKTAK